MAAKSSKKKTRAKKLLTLILVIIAIVVVLRLLGVLPSEELESVESGLSSVSTETAAVTESPAPYATKPIPTAPGQAASDTPAAYATKPVPTVKPKATPQQAANAGLSVQENGSYISMEEVALYLHTFGRLPDNFISKSAAEDLGWVSSKGNLDEVAPGKSIGGSRFGNYEGLLPDAAGRVWYECDINYTGGYRGGERIVYSNDGLIYYSSDHYESFIQLY